MSIKLNRLLNGPAKVKSALHGPAHPEEFRIQVGRFGDRHYIDPLDSCSIAEATDAVYASVSTIKRASEKDWSNVTLDRIAPYLVEKRDELAGMDASEVYARLQEINRAGLKRAAGRGTSVHNLIEAWLAGDDPDIPDSAAPYADAMRQWIEVHQPELVGAEMVGINRELGYGGTLDAYLRIGGEVWLVDWKTRKPGKHGAYEEEAWQLAAYDHFDYNIVDDGGRAVRRLPPKADGLMVVSACPEGTRNYPVDRDKAWDGFQRLHGLFLAKRENPIGRPKRFDIASTVVDKAIADAESDMAAGQTMPFATEPQPIGPLVEQVVERIAEDEIRAELKAEAPSEAFDRYLESSEALALRTDDYLLEMYRAWLKGRVEEIKPNRDAAKELVREWPQGVPFFKSEHVHTVEELEQIGEAVDAVAARFELPFTADPRLRVRVSTPEPPAPPPEAPLEGPDMTGEDVLAVIRAFEALPDLPRMAANAWAQQAHRAGVGFSIRLKPSRRRWSLYRAVIRLAPYHEDDDVLLALLEFVVGELPDGPVGEILGALSIDQADKLADACDDLNAGRLVLHFTDGGKAHIGEFSSLSS